MQRFTLPRDCLLYTSGANIFKLGGAVITFGIVASFIVGGLRYVITYFW